LTIFGLAVTLTFDLLTSKSNMFTFVPNGTEVVNLVKLLHSVRKISYMNKPLVYDRSRTDARTKSPTTECLRHRFNGDGGTKIEPKFYLFGPNVLAVATILKFAVWQ